MATVPFRFPLPAPVMDARVRWRRLIAGAPALEGYGAPRHSLRYARFHLLFGVALPLVALVLECWTRVSARAYMDPVPGPGWLLLAASAPLANLLVLCRPRRAGRRLLAASNALALAVAAGYSAIYLPVAPLALLGVLFGVGLLPLAPFFTLLTAFRLRRHLGGVL